MSAMDGVNRYLQVVKRTAIRLIEDDCFGQAKGAAYSFILFFFPLLLFLLALLVVTDTLALFAPWLLDFISDVVPPSTHTLIRNYVSAMLTSTPTDLLVGTFVVMVWIGSGMMVTFMEGLDRAYRLPPRSLVRQRLVAILLIFLVGIPMILMVILTLFGSLMERFIESQFHLVLPWFWTLGRWGVELLAAMIMIAIIYYVGPSRRPSWRRVLPGAGLATGLWVLVSVLFTAYIDRFGRYNVIYGSLGAGIVLLIWMYLTSLVVFIGGEFNAVLMDIHMADRASSPPHWQSPQSETEPPDAASLDLTTSTSAGNEES